MKILRKGASADHGDKSVEIPNFKVTVDSDDGEFLLKCDQPIRDFSATGSKHMYRVRVLLSEYAAMTKVLADNIKSLDDEVIEELVKLIVPFQKLGHLALKS